MIYESIFNRIAQHYGLGNLGGIAAGAPQSYPIPGTNSPTYPMSAGALMPSNAIATGGRPGEQPGLFSRLTSGIGLLLNRAGAVPTAGAPSGVTASAGGWPIDANGNLINPSTAPAYDMTQRHGLVSASNMGPGAAARNNMVAIRGRNII